MRMCENQTISDASSALDLARQLGAGDAGIIEALPDVPAVDATLDAGGLARDALLVLGDAHPRWATASDASKKVPNLRNGTR